MKFTKIPAPDFDLAMTLDSGQVFHWEKSRDGFVGTIGDCAVYVEQRDQLLKVRFGETPKPACETRTLPRIVAHYFALDHPLAEICASFPDDPIMTAACDFCRGVSALVNHAKSVAPCCTRSLRRSGSRELSKNNYAHARSVIAPSTCARLRSWSVPANVIWKHGRRFPMPSLENAYAHCPAWERRSQIA